MLKQFSILPKLNTYFLYAKLIFRFCPRLNSYLLHANLFFAFPLRLNSDLSYVKKCFKFYPRNHQFPTTLKNPKKVFLIC